MHEDRNRMERDIELLEENEYYPHETAGVPNTEMVWRSQWEIQEWAYEQGYDSGIEPLWTYFSKDMFAELGEEYLKEGPECAEYFVEEEISQTIDKVTDEYLTSYIDGQLRMYAGYDVAENGDTLEEGDYGVWEDLRMYFEAGMRDKLEDNEMYVSIE